MATKKRKDYDRVTNKEHPIYAFRTFSQKHKADLADRIERVVDQVNKKIGDKGRKRTKHEVVIDALERGLGLLESEAGKK